MQPQAVTDLDLAFPANVEHLMPEYGTIPEEFRNNSTKWNEIVDRWFYSGLKKTKFVPKDGIDPDVAIRHLACIMRSFGPKHEHKTAAVAHLMSEWFEDVLEDVE